MEQIKKALDFFLYSNIFIALCAAAMTAETYLLIHSRINLFYVEFVFSSTLLLYNFPVFFEKNFSSDHSERHRWILENKKLITVISVISFLEVAVLMLFFPFNFLLSFIPITVIAFAYFFPQTHLRNIAGLKAGIVTLVWTSVTVIYPLLLISELDIAKVFAGDNRAIILQNFFFMFPLCVIFNVRDIEADQKAGVKTFPVIYGVKSTIAVCLISLLLFSVLIIFSAYAMEAKIAFLFSAAATAAFLLAASEKRSDYYYTLWIDGMILLQASLLFFASSLEK